MREKMELAKEDYEQDFIIKGLFDLFFMKS